MVVAETSVGTAGASLGIFSLLAGWLGIIGADVAMVLMCAIGGNYISISGESSDEPWAKTIGHLVVGVIMCLAFSWGFAQVIVTHYPQADSVYLPSAISFCLGVVSRRIPRIINAALGKGEQKIGLEEAAK